jgi:hypothetical protein
MRRSILFLAAALLVTTLHAQKPQKPRNNKSGYDNAARATVLHTANVYVTADTSSPPITTVGVGHEVVVSARNGDWINVFANTDTKDAANEDSEPEFTDPADNPDPSSGWIRDKGIVSPSKPRQPRRTRPGTPPPPRTAFTAASPTTSPTRRSPPTRSSAPPTSAGSSTRPTSPRCPARTSSRPTCARNSMRATCAR